MTRAEHGGGCICGAVRYRMAGTPRPVVACHCRECRVMSGHFMAATQVDRADLTIEGAENLTWFRATAYADRGFCRTCGSHLFFQPVGDERISVFAGSLDNPTGLKLAGHIYVAEKGDYYTISADLPWRSEGAVADILQESRSGETA